MPNLANLPRASLSCDHLTSAMVHRLREEPGSCSPLQPVSLLIPSWFSQLLSDPSSHTFAHAGPSACSSPCWAGCSCLCGTWLGHQNLTPGPLLNPQPGPLTGKMGTGAANVNSGDSPEFKSQLDQLLNLSQPQFTYL